MDSCLGVSTELRHLFESRHASLLLYDLDAGSYVLRLAEAQSRQRIAPCSTFKIPLALMAFDAGILENPESSMTWDGQDYGNGGWNCDQTARSWMKNSTVWFSQRLTPPLGLNRIQKYLADFSYGNQDFSGGLTQAWLNSTLLISAEEQIEFLARLWAENLPVTSHAIKTTKLILPAETLPQEHRLMGKTGSSGLFRENNTSQSLIGWYVGYLTAYERNYAFVVNFDDIKKPGDSFRPGLVAKQLLEMALDEVSLYNSNS